MLAWLALAGCSEVDARLSGVVAFTDDANGIDRWLEAPGRSMVEAVARFPSDLGDDVLFGVDQELLDGVADPLYVEQGDWMALVGVQRTGTVWIAAGTDETMAGEPSSDRNWVIDDLGAPLAPDTWYTLRVVADYATRHFVSFQVVGPDVDVTLDLSEHPLDFPNRARFDRRAMTWYVWTIRGSVLGGTLDTASEVAFDDLRGGPLVDGVPWADTLAITNGCEAAGPDIPEQPIDLLSVPRTGIPVDDYEQGAFYLERPEARCRYAPAADAHGGEQVCACDPTLERIGYDAWIERSGR